MAKVRKLQVIVVPQYITEDREIRLFLAPVRERVWPKLCAKVKQIGCWLQQSRITRLLLRWLLIFSMTSMVGIWAINQAYQARSYWAYGGEYLLIMVVFCGTYKILHYLGL